MVASTSRIVAALVVATLLAAPAHAQTQVKRGFNLFSKTQDVEVGQKAAQETEEQLPVLTDAEITAFVDQMGKKLAAVSQGPKFPYSFKVVDVADINAFALPGGPIYVHRGTIEAARNDGELAGVLAHEIAHVALRHGTHEVSKAMRAQLLVGLAAGVIGGNAEQLINQVGGFGLQALYLKYSRGAETEADVVGVQTLVKAGMHPDDMVGFFQTLEAQDKQRVAEWMSSHPSPDRRIERIRKEAGLLKVAARTSAPPPSDAMRRVKEKLARMPRALTLKEIAEREKNGGSTSSSGGTGSTSGTDGRPAAPSTTLKAFATRDGSLRVSVPDDWQVVDQGPSAATLAPRGGTTATSDGGVEVTWGILLGRHGSRQSGLDASTDAVVEALQAGSPYLRVVNGSRRAIRDAAGDGRVLTLQGQNPRTRLVEHIDVVTRAVAANEAGFLLFVMPPDAPDAWVHARDAVARSFRTATPSR